MKENLRFSWFPPSIRRDRALRLRPEGRKNTQGRHQSPARTRGPRKGTGPRHAKADAKKARAQDINSGLRKRTAPRLEKRTSGGCRRWGKGDFVEAGPNKKRQDELVQEEERKKNPYAERLRRHQGPDHRQAGQRDEGKRPIEGEPKRRTGHKRKREAEKKKRKKVTGTCK